MIKQQQDVTEFHNTMGLLDPKIPTKRSEKTCTLRARLMFEELKETVEAMGFADISASDFDPDRQDLVAIADGLADLLYVTYGTAIAFGIDIEPVWNEVHRSNCSKFDDGWVDEHGKLQKGPNYSPADLDPIIREQINGKEQE